VSLLNLSAALLLAAGLRDYGVDLAPAAVAPGMLQIAVVNTGQRTHNLRLTGEAVDVWTPNLRPGEGATLAVGLTRPGAYALICDVAYHQQKGMVAVLTVAGDPGGAPDPPALPDAS
jgi:plastocyanin